MKVSFHGRIMFYMLKSCFNMLKLKQLTVVSGCLKYHKFQRCNSTNLAHCIADTVLNTSADTVTVTSVYADDHEGSHTRLYGGMIKDFSLSITLNS